jgi:drug/metabolite transporter (DMT)-like permease
VVALLLGAWFLDERLTFGSIAAAVLVLVGVALVLFQDISLPRVLKTLVPDKSRIVRSRQ